jgi:hypothetical protein
MMLYEMKQKTLMCPSPGPKTKTAAADRDGDGMLNWQEYVAGTDPANALSYLKIDSITEGVGATLAFGAISNKTYSIQYTTRLASALGPDWRTSWLNPPTVWKSSPTPATTAPAFIG